MDKFTNGYVDLTGKSVGDFKKGIKQHFEEECLKQFGKRGKAKVSVTPIQRVTDADPLQFTHAYKVRIRG